MCLYNVVGMLQKKVLLKAIGTQPVCYVHFKLKLYWIRSTRDPQPHPPIFSKRVEIFLHQ